MRGKWLLHHQLRAKVVSSDARPAWAASAVAADDEAVVSKFAARVGSMASEAKSFSFLFHVWCGFDHNESDIHMHTQVS